MVVRALLPHEHKQGNKKAIPITMKANGTGEEKIIDDTNAVFAAIVMVAAAVDFNDASVSIAAVAIAAAVIAAIHLSKKL